MQEQFKVQNVKCGGCAKTIQDGLGGLPGVEGVEVEVDSGTVTVSGNTLERAALAAKLAELGYPEA
ncbi:heavy-metal-associated domain-containing protein [Thiohalobacter sp. IOR34]|uniref:heavy-metal-associated domain-containing protein n=1 Tax=Thiohalobacter sp. IOR34 TaxID=3057176 RepID=UPI0025B0232B|nr:heavy-metal-associated domain-containing protein [Thiohalobacter sp. IOR34]WJW74854.1 heavy-metal-associated domain-containing protein [Thiohalobacter sp. IOR34]